MFPLSAEADGFSACKFGSPTGQYANLSSCDTLGPILLGDKLLTLNGSGSLFQLPNYGKGAILFDWQEAGANGYLDDKWKVTVDFTPDIEAPPERSGTFKYTLDVMDPNYLFATVDLDSVKTGSTKVGGEVKVSKIFPDGYVSGPLISINGNNPSDPVDFQGDFTSIAVTDTYALNPPGDGSLIYLDSFVNTFTQKLNPFVPPETVPGPLPLLGAGAAFGFSRRLRSRLLAAKRV